MEERNVGLWLVVVVFVKRNKGGGGKLGLFYKNLGEEENFGKVKLKEGKLFEKYILLDIF